MRAFSVQLRSARHEERIEGVTSFVGEDDSGSFGLLAGHARFMTELVFGLAQLRVGDGPWRYLAVPRALLHFVDGVLTLDARRFVLDDDYERISRTLREELVAEERQLRGVRASLQAMEEQLLKRMWQVGRETRIEP